MIVATATNSHGCLTSGRRGSVPCAGVSGARTDAVAKLVTTDTATRVTTDAVQVLGGYGYTREFRVERYMR
ncbi:hypothetical protein GCM10022224_079300 [Nonomuraea antimicrobica]|uniref:Acyl-CoA dehydrogenase/oxidase C-terminal domain-containing protein n=1 Tax=Nonomuraea antimicrobica TaxID=561173 RepID=A0ABP7D6J4_9ACTN